MTDGLRIAHLMIAPQWAILRWAILRVIVEDGDYDNYDYNDRPTVIYTVTLKYLKKYGAF